MSYDALVDLLKFMESFLNRIDIYTKFPPTVQSLIMHDIIMHKFHNASHFASPKVVLTINASIMHNA
jgi:hypothetical protein